MDPPTSDRRIMARNKGFFRKHMQKLNIRTNKTFKITSKNSKVFQCNNKKRSLMRSWMKKLLWILFQSHISKAIKWTKKNTTWAWTNKRSTYLINNLNHKKLRPMPRGQSWTTPNSWTLPTIPNTTVSSPLAIQLLIVLAVCLARLANQVVIAVKAKTRCIWRAKSSKNKRKQDCWRNTGLSFWAKSCIVINSRVTSSTRRWRVLLEFI